jgi:hypothetical protein
MRTKEIDGRICHLICGGPKFKIYSPAGIPGWLIVVNNIKYYYTEIDPPKIVRLYCNLKYQPIEKHDWIKAEFDEFIRGLSQKA